MERQNPFRLQDPAPLPPESTERPLEVCLVRGEAIESRHRVHLVVYSSLKGQIVHQWGNGKLAFFPRSSVKALQACSWVEEGLAEKWSLGSAELAVACGSHHGEPRHVKVVEAWLAKLGLKEADLECGVHSPYHQATAQSLVREGQEFCQLHNNCSGKHAGLLTLCRAHGWETRGYSSYDHPVQEKLRGVLTRFYGTEMGTAAWGIDGCGIPTYSITLETMARAMASLADAKTLEAPLGVAVRTLNKAIVAEPAFIGGSASYCSQVVAETEGRVFAKLGAEGVYGAWLPKTGLGIAVKCEDGNARASELALAEVLRTLGHPLGFYSSLVRRWTGEVVGQFVCA